MTINIADNTPRVSYSVAQGVTQTSFAVTFEFFDDEDLNVYVVGTQKTLTTDYTVSGGDGSTGTVTISVTGATGGSTVVITRSIELERTTDFPASGAFQIDSLNTELDRFTAISADLNDEISRSLRLTDYDTAVSLVLPDVNSRKGTVLAFDSSTGAVVAGPTTSGVNTLASIATDVATLADIEDGTVATDAISDLAAIASNVTTVAGISSNVTTVAGISADVSTVAADGTDIGTVATNITSVNTVATNIADVITVANDLNEAISEIETAADDLNEAVSEIDTVATNISNVNTVGGISANVTTVAGISANVTTVAGISADTTTVAGISSDVTTVAGISSDVTAVAGDATDIGTVATDISNVNSVATNISNINSVNTNSSNINTVAGISANVTTVAGISANVTTVAGDSADISTVAGISSDVSAVGAVASNVTTVANNLTNVNAFADTYFISATAPSSPTTGDLWFDTTNNTMKVYGSSGFQNAGSSVNGTAERNTYTATAGQTSFAATYDAGYVDVYLNGVKLIDGTDFTATSGTAVVLASGAALNDTVDIVAYGTFELSNFSINDANDVNTSGITNGQVLAYNSTTSDFEPTTITSDLVDDTSPQLGADLDTNGNAIAFGTSKWTIELSTDDLIFKYNGVAKIKFASDGEIVTVDDVTAFGTI